MERVACIPVTGNFEDINKIKVWFTHLTSVGRPCAIIWREVRTKNGLSGALSKEVVGMKYSVWRNISPDEHDYYNELCPEQLVGDFKIIKTSNGFII